MVQLHVQQQVCHALTHLALWRAVEHRQRAPDNVYHALSRVQRGVRVLHYELHPAQRIAGARLNGGWHGFPVESDLPIERGLKTDERLGDRGFTAARFTYQA